MKTAFLRQETVKTSYSYDYICLFFEIEILHLVWLREWSRT